MRDPVKGHGEPCTDSPPKDMAEVYRALFENSPSVMLIIDPDTGAIVDANATACRFYGHDKARLTAMTIMQINTLAPELIRQEMAAAREQRRCFFNFQHRLAGGEIKDVEVHVGPITLEGRQYLHSIVHDVTAHKRLETALMASEKLLGDVFESIQDGISVLGHDLTIQRVNGVMNQWYGQHRPLEGKKCYHCYHDRTSPCLPCPSRRSMLSGKAESDIVHGPPGAEIQWIELYSYPIKDADSGRITGVVEVVRDITAKKLMEASLRQAQKMEAIGTLAGGVAHDFNNILMGIQGRISLMMLDVDGTHPFFNFLKKIEDSVKNASDLTGKLLGFARAGKYETRKVLLNDVVDHTIEMLGHAHEQIRISKHCAEGLWHVNVDRDQIQQVLLALGINARQAMPAGGNLSLRTDNAVIDADAAARQDVAPGNYVKVAVTDTGVGMDEAILPRVFDPFFTTKHRARGTGLGLAAAYGIIRNHNGYINVVSEKGKGTTFTVFLPAAEQNASVPTGHPALTGGRSGLILFVDDEEMIVDIGRSMLEKLGYQVICVSSGPEAIELFHKHHDQIDLVILDMIMPKMGGGDVFDRIRQIDPKAKVVLSSGYSIDEEAAAVVARGGTGFIQKPFTFQCLAQKVKDVLG